MRKSLGSLFGGLLVKWERKHPQESELRKTERAEDSIANYFIMFFSLGFLGLIVLIKLFTGL